MSDLNRIQKISDPPSFSPVEPNHDLLHTRNTLTNIINYDCTCPSEYSMSGSVDLQFSSKGLHLCNLNIRHLVPKLDELRLAMATERSLDIFGVCETFLEQSVSDCQVAIDGFSLLRKHRSDTQNKSGGGLLLYYRNSLNCRRRLVLEGSHKKHCGQSLLYQILDHSLFAQCIGPEMFSPNG